MSLTTTTGIALILSTLVYHGGLAFLYSRAHFGEVLNLPRGEKLFTIAKHSNQYVGGSRIVLVGWIVGAMAYVMLTAILREAGDPIISTLASVLFLIGIGSAIGFWALHVPVTVLAAEEAARTGIVPEYYERHQLAARISPGGLPCPRTIGHRRIWMGFAPDGSSPQLDWMGHAWMGAAFRRHLFEDGRDQSPPGDPQRNPPTSHGDATSDWDIPARQVGQLRDAKRSLHAA